jgi:hypothetical protein
MPFCEGKEVVATNKRRCWADFSSIEMTYMDRLALVDR